MKEVNRVGVYLLVVGLVLSSCKANRATTQSVSNPSSAAQKFAVKYTAILGIPVPQNAHQALYTMAAEWLNTPYQYGGNTKSGTDCSGLTLQIFKQVFSVSIPRTSVDIYKFAKTIKQSDLGQADLVFFKIQSNKVNHVGVHLNDAYFIHATTSKGVTINRLTEKYYATYYHSSGRIKIPEFSPY